MISWRQVGDRARGRAPSRVSVAALMPLCAAALFLVTGCASFLVPNPPAAGRAETPAAGTVAVPPPQAETVTEAPREAPVATVAATAEVPAGPDFSDAFIDDGADAFDEFAPPPEDATEAAARPEPPLRYPPFNMQRRPVRVMIRRGVREITVSATASVQVRTDIMNTTFKGRMHLEAGAGGAAKAAATVNKVKKELNLPCTLYTAGAGEGLIKLANESYRGSLVITPDPNAAGTLMFINLINVEDYLRGVVPLEIGNLKEGDIEAVKAQAVAARTYTYRKMAQRAAQEFDLVSTVSDQVYGGANAEGPTSDMALRLTKDLVMVYNEELVNAYYHSTCGGVTANVEDAWGAQSRPYLRSVHDTRPDGSAYCGESNSFTWTETWTVPQLTNIIKKHSPDGNLDPPFKGNTLTGLEAREYFECGRIKKLRVTSNAGESFTGGDKTRFLLRRNARASPILRSARITEITMSANEVVITGGGHGHGIGMCQVGAIARARSGQQFEKILGAYYTGITIRTVTD